MTLPALLFHPGTHGNFLARCLNVASGVAEDTDFYGSFLGAHKIVRNEHKVIAQVHEVTGYNVFAYITIELSDLYILNWHIFYAANEFGLDLLRTKNFDELINVVKNSKDPDSGNAKALQRQIDIFKDNGVSGLREMFKLSFQDKQGMLTEQADIFANHNVENTFKFSWFYNQWTFCKKVKELLVFLGYDYKVDISHHIQVFLDRKENIIKSKKLVELAFKCYTTNTSMDISKFCIYEQAYLDNLIEQHLGYQIQNWKEYPTNTKTMNPLEAQT